MRTARDIRYLTDFSDLHNKKDEYHFGKSLKIYKREATYDRPRARKITVPFDIIYQMIHSYIINNQISYTGTIPCVPGKQFEYKFVHYNHIYGKYNKYTIPEHLTYEMNLTDYRRLTVLMDSTYGEGEGEHFVYYLFTNDHLKILDDKLAIALIKFIINKRIDEHDNERNFNLFDFYDMYTRKLIRIAEIDDLQFLESIFGDKAKYVLNRFNARCHIRDKYNVYTWGESMFEPININYNGINLNVNI